MYRKILFLKLTSTIHIFSLKLTSFLKSLIIFQICRLPFLFIFPKMGRIFKSNLKFRNRLKRGVFLCLIMFVEEKKVPKIIWIFFVPIILKSSLTNIQIFKLLRPWSCKTDKKAANTLCFVMAANFYQPIRCSSSTICLQPQPWKNNLLKCLQRSPYKLFAASTLQQKIPFNIVATSPMQNIWSIHPAKCLQHQPSKYFAPLYLHYYPSL